MECRHHKTLENKIDSLTATQIRLVVLLEQTVVTKDSQNLEIGKLNERMDKERDKNRGILGVLVGTLVVTGGAIGYFLQILP